MEKALYSFRRYECISYLVLIAGSTLSSQIRSTGIAAFLSLGPMWMVALLIVIVDSSLQA